MGETVLFFSLLTSSPQWDFFFSSGYSNSNSIKHAVSCQDGFPSWWPWLQGMRLFSWDIHYTLLKTNISLHIPLNQGTVQDDFSRSDMSVPWRVDIISCWLIFLAQRSFPSAKVKQLESSKYEAAVASSRLNKAWLDLHGTFLADISRCFANIEAKWQKLMDW